MGSIDNLQCRNKEDRPTMGLTATNTFSIRDIRGPLPNVSGSSQRSLFREHMFPLECPEHIVI